MMRQYELVELVQAYNPNANEALLNKAYVYAMQKHGRQTRASGDPYFAHPLEVAAILTELHLDDATIAVALLHDTIEDTDATRAEIDQLFGQEIGAIVDGLTKIDRLNLGSREEAQAENLRKLLLAISEDVRVLLVKLADRLHNMRTLEFVPEHKRNASLKKQWKYTLHWLGVWGCRTCAPSWKTYRSERCIPSNMKSSVIIWTLMQRTTMPSLMRYAWNWRKDLWTLELLPLSAHAKGAVFSFQKDGT